MLGSADQTPVPEPPVGLSIRPETVDDYAEVSDVVTMAFGSTEEADLVEAIRASPEYIPELALVAELGGQVVGHVMISYALLREEEQLTRVAILAPLAVAPSFHGRGIGSALVRRVTADAEALGEPAVVLEGSPGFYGRLGFEYSVPYGIHISLPAWAPDEAAQVLRLASYIASIRGQLVCPPAFENL
jgi:putative acetyltransferase